MYLLIEAKLLSQCEIIGSLLFRFIEVRWNFRLTALKIIILGRATITLESHSNDHASINKPTKVLATEATAGLLSLSFNESSRLGSQSLAIDENERLDNIAKDKRVIFFIALPCY